MPEPRPDFLHGLAKLTDRYEERDCADNRPFAKSPESSSGAVKFNSVVYFS